MNNEQNMKNLKVAIIHDWLSVFAGSEKVVLALHQLFPSAPIYTTVFNQENFPSQFKDAKIITSFLQKFPFAKKRPQPYIFLTPLAFENFDLSDFDLVISSCHATSKGVITLPETLHICYCHTPMRYLWTPWVDPRAKGGLIKKAIANYLRTWDLLAADRVDKWIANSKTTKERIKKFYKKDSTVIYPPVKTSSFKPLNSVNKLEDYFLIVSRLVSYKYPEIVIEAFNQTGQKLKIIGSGPNFSKLKKLAKKNIEFLGRVSDKELISLYQKALGFIFPAEEDFGIVMVEAMASGRPVLAYQRGGASEIIVKGKTGDFFEKQTPESLQKALKNFDPLLYNPKEVRENAERFDESIFKKKIMGYIEINIKNKI